MMHAKQQPACQHARTRTEDRQTSQCRYVPSFWERTDDGDPFETVIIRDTYVFCADCGELLEVMQGD